MQAQQTYGQKCGREIGNNIPKELLRRGWEHERRLRELPCVISGKTGRNVELFCLFPPQARAVLRIPASAFSLPLHLSWHRVGGMGMSPWALMGLGVDGFVITRLLWESDGGVEEMKRIVAAHKALKAPKLCG